MIKKSKNSIYAALDIGTSKISCIVGKINNSKMEILGSYYQSTKNVKKGFIVNSNKIEEEIIYIVNNVAKKTNTEISNLIVNVTTTNSKSRFLKGVINVDNEKVDDFHIRSSINNSELYKYDEDLHSIHEVINYFDTDNEKKILNPKNLYCKKLIVNIYQLLISKNYYRSLNNILFNSNLNAEYFVASSYASSLATLTEDEKLLGTICIDLGSGVTSVCVIENNNLIFSDAVSVGSNNITNDIVSGLNTTLESAERLKTLYGSVFSNPSDQHEIIDVPVLGSDNNQLKQISRSDLNSFIKPRVEETLELVRQKLKEYSLHQKKFRRVVLTGGGSLLEGIDEYAKIIFDSQVRIAAPKNIELNDKSLNKPQFSSVLGLLLFGYMKNIEKDNFLLENKEKNVKNLFLGVFLLGLINIFK